MKFTNDQKRKIKEAIVARIQHHRREADKCARANDLKGEDDHYNAVNAIRSELYANGFHTESRAGGIFAVCGISITIRAERKADWAYIVRLFKFLEKYQRCAA